MVYHFYKYNYLLFKFNILLLGEDLFSWAIASAGAVELREDEGAKAVFDILLNAQLESEDPHRRATSEDQNDLFAGELTNTKIKSKHDETRVTFDSTSHITFQFGATTVTFNVEKLLKNIGDIAKGDYKLFFILQALDAAKLKPSLTHLNFFGVVAVNTPPDYVKIAAKDVVFLDDKESNCAVIAKAGFTAVVADTAVTLDKRENKTTDTYLAKLEETLPPSVRLKRLIASNHNVNFKSRSTLEITDARNKALLLLTELLDEQDDPIILKELPKLAALFNFTEMRLFSKSVAPVSPTSELLAVALKYVECK